MTEQRLVAAQVIFPVIYSLQVNSIGEQRHDVPVGKTEEGGLPDSMELTMELTQARKLYAEGID